MKEFWIIFIFVYLFLVQYLIRMVTKKTLQRIKANIAKKKADKIKMKRIYDRINGGDEDQDIFDKWELTRSSPFHNPSKCKLCNRRLTKYFLVRRKDDKENIIALGPWCLFILTKFSGLSDVQFCRQYEKIQKYRLIAPRIIKNKSKDKQPNIQKIEREFILEKDKIIAQLANYIDKSPRLKNIWGKLRGQKQNQCIQLTKFVDAKVIAKICRYRQISMLSPYFKLPQENVDEYDSFINLQFEESKLYLSKIRAYEKARIRTIFKKRTKKPIKGPSPNKTSGNGPSPNKPSDNGPSPNKPSGNGPSPNKPSDNGPSPNKYSSNDSSPNKPSDNGPSPNKYSSNDSNQNKASGLSPNKPIDNNSSLNKPTNNNLSQNEPLQNNKKDTLPRQSNQKTTTSNKWYDHPLTFIKSSVKISQDLNAFLNRIPTPFNKNAEPKQNQQPNKKQ